MDLILKIKYQRKIVQIFPSAFFLIKLLFSEQLLAIKKRSLPESPNRGGSAQEPDPDPSEKGRRDRREGGDRTEGTTVRGREGRAANRKGAATRNEVEGRGCPPRAG